MNRALLSELQKQHEATQVSHRTDTHGDTRWCDLSASVYKYKYMCRCRCRCSGM